MHPSVKEGGIEPPSLTAYPSQRRLSGRRGASGDFAKRDRLSWRVLLFYFYISICRLSYFECIYLHLLRVPLRAT